MGKKIVGLDITHQSVTAVIVDSSIHGDRIQAFEKIAFDDLSESDDSEKADNPETTGADVYGLDTLLKKIKEKTDLTGAVCYASYPGEDVFLRNLSTPFSGRKKIKQILSFELEPVLPVPIDTIITDFHEISGIKNKSDDLWIVSASTEVSGLEAFLTILRNNDLEPRLLSVGAMAAATCTSLFSDKGENYIFLDITKTACTLYLISGQQICFVRTFSIHGFGQDSSDNIVDAKSTTQKIAGEVKRTIVSFREMYLSDYLPEFVEISGVMSHGLDKDAFTEKTGCKIREADILSYTGLAMEEEAKPAWNPAEYNSALAVAWSGLSGTDLIKFSESGFSWKKFIKENGKELQGPVILSGILFTLLIINFFLSSYAAGQKVADVEKKMIKVYRETFPSVQTVSPPYFQKMEAKFKVYKNETAFAAKGSGSVKIIDILDEISRKIPDNLDIEFNRFVYGTDDLNISGLADAFSSIDAMKQSLETSKVFRKVLLSSSVKDKKTNKFRFKLKIEM
jgi:Tfp pilus assembly PilM family ATPase